MMFVSNHFFDSKDAKRLSVGIAGAVFTHALILLWLTLPQSQKIIPADTFNPPTNVSIRFVTPVAQPAPIVERVNAEPAQQKSVAEKIVKATAQKPVDVLKPVHDIIPVISDAHVRERRVQPEYPKRALRMHQEGVVWLHVLIGEDGNRQTIKLHKPSQYALLNQAALKAVKKWTFDPNIVNGRATQSWVEIPIEFKIQ